ncbi:MAG: T9SS type A sorting domain-containing protein, partial [Crocinitomicaceae bacterium]
YVVTNNPFDADAPFILTINAKKPTKLKITIYDIMGRSLITLFEGTVGSGTQNFSWDGSTTNCNEVSTGLYFLTIVDKLNTTVIKVAKK